jgi:hypothetical protein
MVWRAALRLREGLYPHLIERILPRQCSRIRASGEEWQKHTPTPPLHNDKPLTHAPAGKRNSEKDDGAPVNEIGERKIIAAGPLPPAAGEET